MLAKSKEHEIGLDEHTEDLLSFAHSMETAFPHLSHLVQNQYFWEMLRLGILYHDLGKTATGFQKMLEEGGSYHFRHEWLSTILFASQTLPIELEPYRETMQCAIVSHHKNFEQLKEIRKQCSRNQTLHEREEQIDSAKNPTLGHEFETLNIDWIHAFLEKHNIPKSQYALIDPLETILKKWLGTKVHPVAEMEKFTHIFLSASLSICDHNASAGIKAIKMLESRHFTFLDAFTQLYSHQKEAWTSKESTLLIAPTGSGKTESAIGWIRTALQERQGRVFYILPFTASINAMVERLNEKFKDKDTTGLLHGKARFFIDEFYSRKEGQSLKEMVDEHRKILRPLKVTTPFQILKWAFGLKGFEKGLTELAGAYLVFDEIHVYERDLFLRLIAFLRWLKQKLDVKLFIMSATIPAFMQEMMLDKLEIPVRLKADENYLRKTKRHKVELLQGNIESQTEHIHAFLEQGKTVIIVCNTVTKAQWMYENIDCPDKILLHSRFNLQDRIRIEGMLKDPKPQLLIGTQAIEVSLNIDYDIIFSEPAPLNALLQRFGRTNREGKFYISDSDKANCFVTEAIEDVHKLIYEGEDIGLIQRTLDELSKVQGKVLDESSMQAMLNAVYTPFDWDEDIESNFFFMLDEDLYPYRVYEENEKEFEAQFDGVEVLPFNLVGDWYQCIDLQKYLEAEKLLVPVSRSFYHTNKKHIIDALKHGHKIIPVMELDYSPELGLKTEVSFDMGLG